jgi:hypothetical protein
MVKTRMKQHAVQKYEAARRADEIVLVAMTSLFLLLLLPASS